MRILPNDILAELERTAVRLADAAASHIRSVSHDRLAVHFKNPRPGAPSNAEPVSNVDREIEARLRDLIRERFPRHVVIGEECERADTNEADFVWVLDPIDGTTNYLNGLPFYASSVAVLYRHVPVAGAIWCACTHDGAPGIYHAHHEGPLSMGGKTLERRPPPAWRGLASEPGNGIRYGAFFESRVLAAAALECAFTAAGVLRATYLSQPAIWDVAAGLLLAQRAGCRVLTRHDGTWTPFTAFSAPNARKRLATLRAWRQPVLIGEQRAVDREAALTTALD